MISAFGTWLAGNPVARRIIGILAAAVALFTGYYVWKRKVEAGVRRQMNADKKVEQAEAATAITNTITENSNEMVRQSERVRSHDVAVVLPDGKTATLPSVHYRD